MISSFYIIFIFEEISENKPINSFLNNGLKFIFQSLVS